MDEPVERRLLQEFPCYYDLHIPDGRGPWPLVIALHGYGGDKASMMRMMRRILGDSIAIATLQGPHQHLNLPKEPSETITFGFGWLSNFKPEESVALHHVNISRIVADLVMEGIAREDCVFLLGFSQAVGVNFRFAFTHPGLLRGVVAISGGIPSDWRSADKYQNCDLDVLYVSGATDQYYSKERVTGFAEALRERARSVDLKFYETGHEIPRDSYSDIDRWIRDRIES